MESRIEEERKSPKWRLVIALTATVVIACVLSFSWFYGFIQDRLFAERQAFFTQFSDKTAENIDAAIDDLWHRNSMCQAYLDLTSPSGQNSLMEGLAYCATTISTDQAIVLAFTEDGSFYSSDGHTGWFGHDSSISLSQTAPERQTGVVNLPYASAENTYFLLLDRFDAPIEVPGCDPLTYMALAIDVRSLQKLSAHGFGESCHTFFVTDTGRKLYQSSESHTFIEGYNILEAIESSAEVIGGGTMDDLLTSFKSEDATAFEISYQDEEWFVSFQTVAEGKHHLVIFAPTDLIGNNAAVLSQVTLWFLLFICVLLGLLFAVFTLAVRSMVRALEREARTADAANRAKSEFLSYMSHDIRTPINGIMGMTGIAMRNEGDQSKVMDCLGKISEASEHLLSLVNDVLDLSRIEQGRTAIVSKPMSLPALLEECAAIIEGQLATRNLDFTRDFSGITNPNVLSDELHLRQILINVLGNAVKFTPDGGSVAFHAWQEPAGSKRVKTVMRVEDTGIGMEEAYLEHIWEPFSQSRQGHSGTYEGTGLGMAITKRFVDMMGGTIEVKSELGRGSTFTVSLEMDIDASPLARKASDGEAFEHEPLRGMHVLLVEDKELNREIAREAIEREGAAVSCATNGQEALELFEASPGGTFDVVLMDIMMPVMNGLEATRAIRSSAHPDAASIPIIALTAHAFDEDARKTAEAGMNHHLSKPINERDLVKTLASYRPHRPLSATVSPGSPNTEASAKKTGAGEPSHDDTTSLEGLRVLLAEDDDLNMEITCVLLEERGASVAQAENGLLALQAFEESEAYRFDVVLMDLHMPVLDGIEAVRRIRALDRPDAKSTPIFALTADYSDEDETRMKAAGVDKALLKPLNINLLAEAIKERRDATRIEGGS